MTARGLAAALAVLAAAALAGCGVKNEPSRPSGKKSPAYTYPRQDTVPGGVPQQTHQPRLIGRRADDDAGTRRHRETTLVPEIVVERDQRAAELQRQPEMFLVGGATELRPSSGTPS